MNTLMPSLTANDKLRMMQIRENYLNDPYKNSLIAEKMSLEKLYGRPYAIIDKNGNLIESGLKVIDSFASLKIAEIDRKIEAIYQSYQSMANEYFPLL